MFDPNIKKINDEANDFKIAEVVSVPARDSVKKMMEKEAKKRMEIEN